jgi:hypothetical protein
MSSPPVGRRGLTGQADADVRWHDIPNLTEMSNLSECGAWRPASTRLQRSPLNQRIKDALDPTGILNPRRGPLTNTSSSPVGCLVEK